MLGESGIFIYFIIDVTTASMITNSVACVITFITESVLNR